MLHGAGSSCFLATQKALLLYILVLVPHCRRPCAILSLCLLCCADDDSDSYVACFCHISHFKCPLADGNQSPHS